MQLLAHPTSAEPAIVAEAAGITISHRELTEQVEYLAGLLCGAGLHPGDVVAIVLPNGPELLITFLALVQAGLIAAPLNPAYKQDELRGIFADIKPRAIVVARGDVAVTESSELAVPIWTVSLEPSGIVSLAGMPSISRHSLEDPPSDAVALYLLTSGTSGRPKVVPLTHANLVCAVQHVSMHCALTPADRTLAVMPLFHGHGLIGVALSALASGGAVIVPPRFSASNFWGSFRRYRASWYSAVPTIHKILLDRADTDGATHTGARFIRSCSAPLAPAVLAALEQRFGAPVVEAYGLTEAGHQVASNPLPPRTRKSGTVGFGIGTEIAIIDAGGRHMPANNAGEVVVRGPSVMHGYRNNPAADSEAFMDGWFRTGDEGVLDDDGYLTLTGRIKEIINRGGEKISPTEIDNVLLAHPAVREAAAFGVPDPKYGEEVVAVVVLKGDVDPEGLRAFCRERLADYKTPKVIRIVSGLPKNAMGKVERRALPNAIDCSPPNNYDIS